MFHDVPEGTWELEGIRILANHVSHPGSTVGYRLELNGSVLAFIPDPLWMAAKIGALSLFVIWLRATYPRMREDQLQRGSWLALIPLALLQVLVVGIVKVAV